MGEESEHGLGLGFHPGWSFVWLRGKGKRERRREQVLPTDVWTIGPIGHRLLRRYYSLKRVKKVFDRI